MRGEDQERILRELESRVVHQRVRVEEAGGAPIQDVLEDSLYHERKRLRGDRSSPSSDRDTAFWTHVQRELRHASAEKHRALLREVVRHYGSEISGHFDPRVYQVATRALPPVLGLLLNAVSPLKLARRLPDLPRIDDAVIIQGETAHLHRLRRHGAVILVPTHVSNMDSIIIGYALFRMGLPPFLYGAGLNLFSNPLLGYFMHNLGAYTVDRKKTDPLYKVALKEYATLTLEAGYDNLFFPGGTRSRSGAVEQHLKLGLLGTGLAAYINNLRRGAARPKVFVVPATLSYELVLEAETLISDFLAEVGKSRYIIEDDEFSRPRRVFEFLTKLVSLDSKIHVTVSRGLDPFGNVVDDDGESIDPCGRHIDVSRYVAKGGEPQHVEDRDEEYTREVAPKIAEAFARDNVVEATHVTAKAVFGLLQARNPKLDTMRLIRTGGLEDDLELAAVYQETGRLLELLRDRRARGGIRLGSSVGGEADEVVATALAHFGSYHSRPCAVRRGDRLVPADRSLLLYYQNRLEGYGLEAALGKRPALSKDHRALAPSR